MVKVITGIRRCGKSYLLFTLFRRHLLAQGVDEQHIITLALDDMLNEEYRNPKALYQYVLDRVNGSTNSRPYSGAISSVCSWAW